MTRADLPALHAVLRDRQAALVEEVAALARHESPTGDAAALDALADLVGAGWEALGATVTAHRVDGVGTHLEIRWPGATEEAGQQAAPVLLVGHMDTVHGDGGLVRNPVRVAGGRLCGPGTQDMKAGLVIARAAAEALTTCGIPPARPVVLLATADEETGSLTSRALIEDRARAAAHAFVLEPCGPGGELKTARKGVAIYEIEVAGRAAHAGMHFSDGVNAAVALARLVVEAAALSDAEAGTTVNVGTVAAGTRTNVVPARAVAGVEARFFTAAEAARVDAALRALVPEPPATVEVRGGVNRPALERDAAVAGLYERACAVAADLGLPVPAEMSVGGASDGNFTAAAGTPTLDGLGALGAGLHTDDEWVDAGAIADRAALLAGLLATC